MCLFIINHMVDQTMNRIVDNPDLENIDISLTTLEN